jgi:integrase
VTELSGLRDRALIGVMVYSFARVSAAATLRVEDYFENGKRAWLRLHEKGGKRHEVGWRRLASGRVWVAAVASLSDLS